jgi:hypothetical protein
MRARFSHASATAGRTPLPSAPATIVHIAIERLAPVLAGEGGEVTLPPIMEETFWTQVLVLFLGYLIIIGVYFLLKSLLFRRQAAH